MTRFAAISGSGFLAYAAVSLLWSAGNPWLSAAWLGSLAGCFWLGSRVRLYNDFTESFSILCLFPLLIGWFWINPNVIGGLAAAFYAAAIHASSPWGAWVFGAITLATFSRGAILAMAVVTFVSSIREYPIWSMVGTGLLLAAIIVVKPDLADSTIHRLGIWQDTMGHTTIFGSGFGSFAEAYKYFGLHTSAVTKYGTFLAPAAYNDFLQAVFELGIGSLLLIFLIVGAFDSRGTGQLVLLAVLVQGLTYFPLSIPILAHFFALTLGHLHRSEYHGSLEAHRPALS